LKAHRAPHPPLRVGLDTRLAFRRGVGTYTACLAKALARASTAVIPVLVNAPPILRESLRGTCARFLDTPILQPAIYEQFTLPALLRREGLDLLHYTDNSAAILRSIPLVVTMHDAMMTRPLSESHDGATWRQRWVGTYKRLLAGPSGRAARLVITVSEASKRDLVERLGVAAGRVRVVPEGVEAGLFARPRGFRPTRRKRPRVLVQGAADRRKNIPGVLQVAAILKARGLDCDFRVIGYPRGDFERAGYIDLAERLGVGDLVDWAGQVPSEGLAAEYWDADLFLYPSLWEGFGLPVLEAFSAGTAVVTSKTTSLPEVAGTAALLADPADPKALANAVQKVLSSRALRQTLTQRGLRRARLFTWEKTAKATARVYQEAVEGNAS